MLRVRITLVVNPFASSVTERIRVQIGQMLSVDHQLSVIETTKGGHALRLAHRAGRTGAELVVALGGDGTINEVANGLLGTSVAAAPLPGGSTNVFARSLGYPNDPVAATSLLLEAVAARSIRPASVGLANGRAFLFHVGMGFDAAVVERVEGRGSLKRLFGHPLYVASMLDTWTRRIDRRRPWLSLRASDGRRAPVSQQAIALNTDPYTFLGSRAVRLAPEASIDEPLSIVSIDSVTLRRLLPAGLRSMRQTGLGEIAGVTSWASVERAEVRGYRRFPYQLDGEFIGWTTRVELESRPGALRLVVPPDTTDQGPDLNEPSAR